MNGLEVTPDRSIRKIKEFNKRICPKCGADSSDVIYKMPDGRQTKTIHVPCRCEKENEDLKRSVILSAEIGRRQKRAAAAVDVPPYGEDYIKRSFDGSNIAAYRKVMSLCDKPRDTLMIGTPKEEKEHTAFHFYAILKKTGLKKVIVKNVSQLYRQIKESYSTKDKSDMLAMLQELRDADYLILLGLGTEVINSDSRSKVLDLIEYRRENKLPTMIETGLKLQALSSCYGHDFAALIDRKYEIVTFTK